MSNYIIELCAIHMVLFLGYWFILRKERQFSFMRLYIVGSTLLSLLIPLLKLPKLIIGNQPIEIINIPSGQADMLTLNAVVITPGSDFTYWGADLLMWVCFSISLFLLIKYIVDVFYLVRLERKSTYEKFNDLYIRRVDEIEGSFTFFNWIFLSNKIDKDQKDYDIILKHEKAHASLGHTYDILFLELFKICFWWLPTTWLAAKEIKKIHEYQADAYALKSYDVDHYSSILISSTLKSNGFSLASSFHDGLILKRLKIMKQKTKNVSLWKIGTLSSIGALLFIVFACSEDLGAQSEELSVNSEKIQEEVFTKVEEAPAPEGGMDKFYSYITKNIKYPQLARKQGIEGLVNVQFVVEKDGTLTNIKVIDGIGAGCDDEAIRVLQSASAFTPGRQRGKAIRVQMTLPIIFKLDKSKSDVGDALGVIVIEDLKTRNNQMKIEASYAKGQWSGTVYDENGKVLPGVNVVVAGTTSGTVTDFDGNFKVTAQESQELDISFIGYDNAKLKTK